MHPVPPDAFTGIGGSSSATHAGYLKFLPARNFINLAYYAPGFPQTLLSLGQLHACGGSYNSTTNKQTHIKSVMVFAVDSDPTSLLDIAPLTSGSNMYPTSVDILSSATFSKPLLQLSNASPYPPASFPSSLIQFTKQHPHPQLRALLSPLKAKSTIEFQQLTKSPYSNLPSAAQMQEAWAAFELHESQAHPPDDKLINEISLGKHTYSKATPSSVKLMRRIIGPCPHCLEGRGNRAAAIRLPSTSPTTSLPGQVISFDPQKLPNTVLGGFTHKIMMVDKHTGFISQPGTTSKSTKPVADAIIGVIQKQYNANGVKVESLHGDAENINISLRPVLGSLGTRVLASIPGDHAQCAERTTQTVQDRARAVLASLPYYLPPEANLLLDQSVGESLNHSTNKSSSPLTPYESLYGIKINHQPTPFGRCAMVKQPDDKRITISKTTGIPFKKVPITELGVSMGLQPGTDYTQFMLANSRVVPRRPIGPIFPRNFVPFGWKPKPTIYNGKATSDPTTPNDSPPIHIPAPEPPDSDPYPIFTLPTPELNTITTTEHITLTPTFHPTPQPHLTPELTPSPEHTSSQLYTTTQSPIPSDTAPTPQSLNQ